MEKQKFPDNFKFGAATASFQVEGGITNCDWADAARKGKVPICGRAADHYNRFEEDFDIAKDLGHNAHRFSIEWARIEPEEGRFNMQAIIHYKKVLEALKERGIEAHLTLWHFTLPQWFVDKGSFENPEAINYFSRYVRFVAEELQDGVVSWSTINEPVVYAWNGWGRGRWPPFKTSPRRFWKVLKVLAKCHIEALHMIRLSQPEALVGVTKDNIYFDPNRNPFNKLLARFFTWVWNYHFLDMISGHQDFIGLNYYFHTALGKEATGVRTDFGWEIYPEGIYHVLRQLEKYNVPVYVMENGLADENDIHRADFIRDHLFWIQKAMQKGVDVRGYFHWSLLDNYEWAEGFGKRFGLVHIDYDTMKRTVRESALVYKKICETHAL
jgi:beta-glucosidase